MDHSEILGKLDYLISLFESKTDQPAPLNKPMSVKETAEYLNLSIQGVYSHTHRGTIPFHKNGKLYFLKNELDSFVNGTWKPSTKK